MTGLGAVETWTEEEEERKILAYVLVMGSRTKREKIICRI